jgi:hypothetical protein
VALEDISSPADVYDWLKDVLLPKFTSQDTDLPITFQMQTYLFANPVARITFRRNILHDNPNVKFVLSNL